MLSRFAQSDSEIGAGKISSLAGRAFQFFVAVQGIAQRCLVGSHQSKLPRAGPPPGKFNCLVLDWHARGIRPTSKAVEINREPARSQKPEGAFPSQTRDVQPCP